jgi:hypothetical protein
MNSIIFTLKSINWLFLTMKHSSWQDYNVKYYKIKSFIDCIVCLCCSCHAFQDVEVMA